MRTTTTDYIALFFDDPSVFHKPPRRYSTLYLLRRDIRTCLGIDPNTNEETRYQALLPAAMAILAGVDLLGKFLAGSDERGQVGPRFREFVKKYFAVSTGDDAETIYQLRNALLHSFGLYSEKTDRHGNVLEYRFKLSKTGHPLVEQEGGCYLVDVLALYNQFEAAVASYQADLEADSNLQTGFAGMFQKYGHIDIGPLQRSSPIVSWLLHALSQHDSVSSV